MVTMMKAFIDGYQLDHMVVELTAIAAAGDKVLTERVDHLKKADGTLLLSIALAGVLHVRDGRVTHWADYFDPRPFLPS
jgi:limonene-1,2-epoxide hydrolase